MPYIQPSKRSSRPQSPLLQVSTRQSDRCQILVKKGFLQAKNLTSRVALLVYSSEFQLGVLLHLPAFDTAGVEKQDSDDQVFAKSALAMILSEFQTLGVHNSDLVTYAIGGSGVDGLPEVSEVMVRRALWAHGMVLSACDLGGHQVRSIWMDVESGRTIVRSEPIKDAPSGACSSLPVAS